MKRLALSAVAWATFFTPCAFGAEAYRDAKLPAEQRVKDLLSRMTLEEKIEQLIQKDASGIVMQGDQTDPASLEKLFHDRSPGVLCVHFGDDLHQSARRLAAGQRYLRERTRWGIPALTVNEGLHGVLAKGATIYPQFLALGCTWNTALAEEVGSQIAAEATAAGFFFRGGERLVLIGGGAPSGFLAVNLALRSRVLSICFVDGLAMTRNGGNDRRGESERDDGRAGLRDGRDSRR